MIRPFRYWVQNIIPLVYEDSLSYMELLGKVIKKLNEVIGVINEGIPAPEPDNSKKNMNKGGNVLLPLYRGDYFAGNSYPQSCVKYGDRVYCFNPGAMITNSSEGSDNGTARVFSISENKLLSTHTIYMAHANSACFNPITGCIYIAGGQSHETLGAYTEWIAEYDTDFTLKRVIDVGFTVQTVTFDHKTGEMYCINGGSVKTLYKYDYDSKTFKPYATVGGNPYISQDAAVYDNILYYCDPTGCFATAEVVEGEMHLEAFGYSPFVDARERFYIAEMEGIEFDETGHLYGMRYSRDSTNRNDCILVEYVLNTKLPEYQEDLWYSRVLYCNLNKNTIGKFRLAKNELRSVEQVNMMVIPPSHITISGGTTEDPVVDVHDSYINIADDIVIDLSGVYQCNGVVVRSGELKIIGGSNSPEIDLNVAVTAQGVICSGGNFAVVGNRVKILTNGSNWLNVGTSGTVSKFGPYPPVDENGDVRKVGDPETGTDITVNSMFYGLREVIGTHEG